MRLPGGFPKLENAALPPLRRREGECADIRRSLPQAFVVDEEERLPAMDGTADVAANLISPEAPVRNAGAFAEVIVGVQRTAAKEPECRSAKLIRAAPRDEIDDAAAQPPELRADGVGLDAELLHGIDRRGVIEIEDRHVVFSVEVRDAVNRHFARRVASAADEGRGTGSGNDTWAQGRQRKRIAAVEGQIDDPLVFNGLA